MPSVWVGTQEIYSRDFKFFLICLAHEDAMEFYKVNFALMQHHKYSLQDIEDMVPYERDIYVAMLSNHLEEEKQRIQRLNQGRAYE